ncbi:MAG: hypothetical protein MUE97_07320, partial [Phycisphaerales bacterium]|nr:hypothetical protein [Phycisphaerales bacterium]
ERLVEPTGLIADPTAPDRPARLEYRFTSSDDRTDSRVIDLVPPPSIQRAEATITPPRYASHLPTRTLDLGPGSDERATIPGVLPGSTVQLRLAFNKPVAALPSTPAGRTPEQLTALLGPDIAAVLTTSPTSGPAPTFISEDGGAAWLLGWTHRSTVRLLPRPTDTQGLTVVGEPAYRIELREDKPPESIITQPAQDTDALATAKLSITGQSRDDVGLASAALRWQIATRPGGSAGAAAEPSGEPTDLIRQTISDPSTLTTDLASPLDLATLNVRVGQEVWLTVLAQDRFEIDGAARAPVASPVRVIRIISPEQLLEQLWAELAGVQRAAQRLSEQQQALADRLKAMDAKTPSGAQAEVARRQSEISEQLARAGETVARAGQRQRDNGLEDAELGEVLRQARELAEQARGASSRAAQAAQQAEGASQNDRPTEAAAKRGDAASAQREALDRLDQLAETLDRGQDTWAARRGVERLLREQAALREATSAIAPETLGKRPDELTAQQRAALQDLADRQEQLGRRADEAFRNLDQRAEQLQQRDAGAAESLRDAARQGRQSGASDQMQQAARSVQRNAQQQAQQAQQRAEQALQNVLNQLRDQARSRDAVLRRQLASLTESIDELITRQRAVLTDLAAAPDDAARAAQDAPQIRVNTSTLSTAQQAREAGREARTAARLLEEAAAAQTEAITALRRKPAPDAPQAEAAMRSALTKLEEARAESQRQQQQAGQREQARQREQIRRQYETLLVEATAIRVDSADLIAVDLDRRTRNRARGLADRHAALSTQLADMLAKTAELQSASMIALAHQRMEAANTSAAEQLRAERVEPRLRISQMTVERVLRQLIEALTDQQPTPNEFRENEAGGGGGGGQQGGSQPLIPPVTELRLLRSMQDEALTLTREADAGNDAALKAEAASVQAALAGRAEALLQAMQRQQQGGGGEGGGGGGGGGGAPRP